jgi:hypothetical protein
MGLISLANVKTLWGITDSSQDAVLNLLIAQCSARCATYVGHVLEATNLTEYYRGTGTCDLVLLNWPVNSITSVHEDMGAEWGQAADAFAAATELVAGVDYSLRKDGGGGQARSGILRRIGTVWQKPTIYVPGTISPTPAETSGTIRVVYNAGFATIPDDLQQACLLLMACVKRILKIGQPLSSEGWEDYNYAVAAAAGDAMGGLPADALATLSRLRNVSIG